MQTIEKNVKYSDIYFEYTWVVSMYVLIFE